MKLKINWFNFKQKCSINKILILLILILYILGGIICHWEFERWVQNAQIIVPILTVLGILYTVEYSTKTSDNQILEQKKQSFIQLKTQTRIINIRVNNNLNKVGSLNFELKKIKTNALSINQAIYAASVYYGNFQEFKKICSEEYLLTYIDEEDERDIFHATFLPNYEQFIEHAFSNMVILDRRTLLEKYSPNKKFTPLMYAVYDNNISAVKYLISKGVDKDQRVPDVINGFTAFCFSILYRREKIAKLLKKNGANINIEINQTDNIFTIIFPGIIRETINLCEELKICRKSKNGTIFNSFVNYYSSVCNHKNENEIKQDFEYIKNKILNVHSKKILLHINQNHNLVYEIMHGFILKLRNFDIATILIDRGLKYIPKEKEQTILDFFLNGIKQQFYQEKKTLVYKAKIDIIKKYNKFKLLNEIEKLNEIPLINSFETQKTFFELIKNEKLTIPKSEFHINKMTDAQKKDVNNEFLFDIYTNSNFTNETNQENVHLFYWQQYDQIIKEDYQQYLQEIDKLENDYINRIDYFLEKLNT